MDDLISRQEAIDALNRLCPYPGEWSVNGLGLCKDAIANLPSIDAVPVIRCKDCKWSDWYTSFEGKVYCYCMETGAVARTEEDFCSRAEREEE